MVPVGVLFILASIFGHWGRLHDVGKSGWWWFLHWIPYLGSLGMWIFTLFIRGDEHSNEFGPPQEPINLKPWLIAAGTTLTIAIGLGDYDELQTQPVSKSSSEYEGLQLNETLKAAYEWGSSYDEPASYRASYFGENDNMEVRISWEISKQCGWTTNSLFEASIPTANGTDQIVMRRESIEPSDGGAIFFREKVSTYSAIDGEEELNDSFRSETKEYRAVSISEEIRHEIQISSLGQDLSVINAPADTLFPAASHQKVVRLIQENKDLPPVQTIVLTVFDPTMEELFTSSEYTLTKVRLDSSFDLWELSNADGTSLVTAQGVELWVELNVPEQDTRSFQINNFAPIEGECLSLE
jgi:hypothetical protein